MKQIIEILDEKISKSIESAAGQEGLSAIVRTAGNPKFGDYQANGVMAAAKKLNTNPRQMAEQIVKNLDVSDICSQVEVAGPGFINLTLKSEFISDRLKSMFDDCDNRLGVDRKKNSKKTVVDFSGPNIAKQMHVGHLRSTIIGDCICRLLGFEGAQVIRQNHIGDWGTQFGMLCAYYDRVMDKEDKTKEALLCDLENFYKEAKKLYDSDSEFAQTARSAVAALHNGDKKWINKWKTIVAESEKHYQQLYNELAVKLTNDDIRGESFYNNFLPGIVKDFKEKNLAIESDGAVCVFPKGFKNKNGEPLPLIIQKSDGAYLYATTDLAALKFRINQLGAEKIVYVTDSRQSLHFEMVFAAAKMAGWVTGYTKLEHITFGSVLGEDGKPFKTRSGENVKLKDLLAEAVKRAKAIVDEKNPDLDEDEKSRIAEAVGIGAVKYADYSNNRTSDYIFSFDKMMAMDGNTAPYMQYAYARIKSIERKAEAEGVELKKELSNADELNLTEPQELDLAKHIIRYDQAIGAAAQDFRPNYLTEYLYELSQKFSTYYANCPVIKAEPNKRPTRLVLCRLTEKIIQHGLENLLGITVLEQM
jgi:arginyl-tRNA synthetase